MPTAIAVACACLAPARALAFCRSTTCEGDCPVDADNCKTTGAKLAWSSACVGFSLQEDGSADLPTSGVRPVIERAFVAWSDLACSGGEASIAFAELPDAACHAPSYDPNGPNANVIMFQDDKWTFTGIDDNLALTTVTFDPSSGEIWDADIQINTAYNHFTLGDADVDYDLQSIVTHEIGHFIGFDHTLVADATMNADYVEGTTWDRTLAKDDLAGACAIYPAGRDARCETTPRGGFSGACAPPAPAAASGCAVAARQDEAPTPGGPAGLAALFGAAVVASTRRRSARSRVAAALLGVAVAAIGACSSTPADTAPQTLCDPASVIFCRCFDGATGSKTCSSDGQSFDACRDQDNGAVCDHFESSSTTSTASTSASTTSAGGGGSSAGGGGSGAGAAGGAGAGAGGASAGGGGASAGGGGASGTCPGAPLSVAMGTDTSVSDTNARGVDDASDRCGGAGARELVYEVTPASSGTLVVQATGVGATDPVLYARTGDCAAGVSLGCVDATGAGGVETLTLEAVAGTPIWVFVDAKPGAEGPFALSLHLEVGVPGDTCPGNPIAIDAGATVTAGGDTSIAGAQYKGSGACATSGTKEIVYAVTPSVDGMLTVTMTPDFDAQLYARSGSCTSSVSSTQLGCSDAPGAGAVETLTFPVTAGTKYSVFADGAPGAAGAFTIAFSLH